ncbi:MAG: glycoside hydrolase family 31 protein [Candidatus Eremiobacteraeota bacterium]|nr:glycoside hydrolase family 31 protein [Candidatus Eremiobacteraeota bacterium]
MRTIFALAALLITLTVPSWADFTFAGDAASCTKHDTYADFKLSNAAFQVHVIKPDIIRFRFNAGGKFSEAPSYAVRENKAAPVQFSLSEKPEYYELATGTLTVRITKKPCRVAIHTAGGTLLCEDEKSFGMAFDGGEVRCFKRLFPDERFFGLGEKTGTLDRRGSQYTMWNSDFPSYTKKQDPLYSSIPFFIAERDHQAYGIFMDNTYKSYFNMGASNNRLYWFGAEKGDLDYYFIWGPSMKKVISSYTELTGRMELPPLWALGYQQSRWSYFPEEKVREVARSFRKHKIPCDVIYLDIDYMDGYRVFTWDKTRFPDPAGMIADLGRDGFKIVTIIDPGVKADSNYFAAQEGLARDLFAKYPDGVPFQGQVWPSWAYFPDFTKKETRAWWGEKLSALMAQGIAGFWNDMNEPALWGGNFIDIVRFDDNGHGADHRKAHNVYGLEMAHATFDALNKYSDKRPFILTRAGFSGTQRYAAMWTGDNVASEDHLKLACFMPLSMGISGLPFVGSDVGGFDGCPSPSLYIRWMQLGAFTPFFRGHSCTGMPDKEPWALGETARDLTRDIITLRYRLLPFLYSEFSRASKTGIPLMRPMFLNFQHDDECYKPEAQEQFMVGDSFLVAPVLSEHETAKKLYLPAGKWLDWWKGTICEGKQWITSDAPLHRVPLYLREGAVVPLGEPMQFTGEKVSRELEFKVFPGGESSWELYEDDGVTRRYKDGIFSTTAIKINGKGTLTISRPVSAYKSPVAFYAFTLCGMKKPRSVSCGAAVLSPADSPQGLKAAKEGYFYDTEGAALTVRIATSRVGAASLAIQVK